MLTNDKLLIGKTESDKELAILPQMANRHGIITGASGSGKTITLKIKYLNNLNYANNCNFRYKNLICIKDEQMIDKIIKKTKYLKPK